jgi:hypothetical protein
MTGTRLFRSGQVSDGLPGSGLALDQLAPDRQPRDRHARRGLIEIGLAGECLSRPRRGRLASRRLPLSAARWLSWAWARSSTW